MRQRNAAQPEKPESHRDRDLQDEQAVVDRERAAEHAAERDARAIGQPVGAEEPDSGAQRAQRPEQLGEVMIDVAHRKQHVDQRQRGKAHHEQQRQEKRQRQLPRDDDHQADGNGCGGRRDVHEHAIRLRLARVGPEEPSDRREQGVEAPGPHEPTSLGHMDPVVELDHGRAAEQRIENAPCVIERVGIRRQEFAVGIPAGEHCQGREHREQGAREPEQRLAEGGGHFGSSLLVRLACSR